MLEEVSGQLPPSFHPLPPTPTPRVTVLHTSVYYCGRVLSPIGFFQLQDLTLESPVGGWLCNYGFNTLESVQLLSLAGLDLHRDEEVN